MRFTAVARTAVLLALSTLGACVLNPSLDLSPTKAITIDLQSAKSAYARARVTLGTPVVVETAPEQYAYAASWALTDDHRKLSSCEILIKAETDGQVQFNILDKAGKKFLTQTTVKASILQKTVSLNVEAMQDAGSIILSNAAPQPNIKSVVKIHEISMKCKD